MAQFVSGIYSLDRQPAHGLRQCLVQQEARQRTQFPTLSALHGNEHYRQGPAYLLRATRRGDPGSVWRHAEDPEVAAGHFPFMPGRQDVRRSPIPEYPKKGERSVRLLEHRR